MSEMIQITKEEYELFCDTIVMCKCKMSEIETYRNATADEKILIHRLKRCREAIDTIDERLESSCVPVVKNEMTDTDEMCECFDDTQEDEYPIHMLVKGSEKIHLYMNINGIPQIDLEADYKCTKCGRKHTHCESFISTEDYDWV